VTHELEWTRGDYTVSTDPRRLDRPLIRRFLREEAHWSRGVPADVVDRALRHSLVFGLFRGEEQVGFARAVTDRASFAYLADVFVLPEHRGRGLGTMLVDSVLAHPDLQGLRRFLLATADAHPLYARFGFAPLERTERFLTIERTPDELYGPTRALSDP
jgi:GNAT superfamily N-acetyltransferase